MNLFKTLSLYLTAGALLFVAGCTDPEENTLSVSIQPKFGSQNFSLNTVYTDATGTEVKFSRFRFYISHLTLVKSDDSQVEISDVALLDLSNSGTLTINKEDISGDFKAIRFSLGVDSNQNNTDPQAVSSNSPLHDSNEMYWPMFKYVFAIAEGKADSVSSGAANFNLGISYHIGKNSNYRHVELTTSFSVCCNKQSSVVLNMDVEKIFSGPGGTINLVSDRGTDSDIEHPEIAVRFVDNFAKAFSAN